jgi:hypothetical protein
MSSVCAPIASWTGAVSWVTSPDEMERPSTTARGCGDALSLRLTAWDSANALSMKELLAPQSTSAKLGMTAPWAVRLIGRTMSFSDFAAFFGLSCFSLAEDRGLDAAGKTGIPWRESGGLPSGAPSTAAGLERFPAAMSLRGWLRPRAQAGGLDVPCSRGRRGLDHRSRRRGCFCGDTLSLLR